MKAVRPPAARREGPPRAAIALLAPLAALCAWPTVPFRPLWGGDYFGWGIDFSWIVALHMAAVERLEWGREVIFTYGPLGFASGPMLISPATSAIGLAFVALVTTALAAALLLALERWMGLALAFAAAVVATTLLTRLIPEAALFAGLLLAGLVLGSGGELRRSPWLLDLLAAGAAILLLVKGTTGVILVAVTGIAILGRGARPLRHAVRAAGVFAVVLVGAWLATGQPLLGLPVWLRGMVEIVAGYTEAMAIEMPGTDWHLVAFGMLAAANAVAFVLGSERGVPRQRRALLAILLLAGLALTKAGFVRHDASDHPQIAFSFLLVAPLLVPWRPPWRPAAIALTLAAGATLTAVRELPPAALFDAGARVRALSEQLAILSSAERRDATQGDARAALRAMLAVPPAVVAAVEGRRVHVEPHDVAVAWAYGLDWAPAGVLQSYNAYTPWLDRLGAARLADPRGPELVVRRAAPRIDGRHSLWETPEYALALLCRYRERVAEGAWQVLERGPDRCGEPHALTASSARPGEPLEPPAAGADDRIVIARLDAKPPLDERLRSFLFKPRQRLFIVAGGRRERLVRAQLAGPLLVRIPPTSGWSPAFGGSWSLGAFAIEGSAAPIPVRFEELRLAPLTPDGAEPQPPSSGGGAGDRAGS